nr:MAG TPA_asm: hypothetical protein [Caudoviricetes sp.]
MMGRRPEPVPGVEPGRWRVVRVRGVGSSTMDWYVDRENCHGSMWFPTWREAVDYADRMARTREVVLPRLAPHGALTVSTIWGNSNLVVHYIDASGQTVKGTPADLARHAVTLLALAEMEGTA